MYLVLLMIFSLQVEQGKDQDETLDKVLWIGSRQNWSLIKVNVSFLQWNNFITLYEPRPKRGLSPYTHAITKDSKEAKVVLWL